MPKLQIDLNEGFLNDVVDIRVNGSLAAQLQDVSTNYSLGLAGHAQQEVPAGPCRIEVSVSGKGAGQTEFALTSDTYLKVRKENGHLLFQVSTEPPVYF